MPSKRSANEPLVSIAIEKRAREACNDLMLLSDPMTPGELRERAFNRCPIHEPERA